MMNKLVRNGKVAVLYSPGFGAGWSTWNDYGDEVIFDPVLATLVLDGKMDEAQTYVTIRWPDAYASGVEDLSVAWITQGKAFRIHEYDGSESIEVQEEMNWVIA